MRIVQQSREQKASACFLTAQRAANTTTACSWNSVATRWFWLCSLFILAQAASGQAPPFEWVRHAGGTYPDQGTAIALDSSGNIYVTGPLFDRINFGGTQAGRNLASGLFIAKYDSQGSLLWVTSHSGTSQAGSPGEITAAAIGIDSIGNVYVAGSFYRDATFGGSVFVNGSGFDMVVLKHDPAGNLLWARHGDAIGDAFANGLAIDQDGNVHVIGTFRFSIVFGAQTLTDAGGGTRAS